MRPMPVIHNYAYAYGALAQVAWHLLQHIDSGDHRDGDCPLPDDYPEHTCQRVEDIRRVITNPPKDQP